MNSQNNSIDRQSSFKLKDRWINAFQNENLIDRSIDDGPDPKEGEDQKEQNLECHEDLFLDEAGPKGGGFLRNISEYIKVVKVMGDLEEEGADIDKEKLGDADKEEHDDVDEEEGCNEFRDRVPSVTELQQQLEELMKALINLQISRSPNW